MRIAAAHDNSVETNVAVESQNFGIADTSRIIEILRNHMYEHKIRSICQEIMSNGRDASREVQSNKRIIVNFPSRFDPVFKVRDFGPGITPDRMSTVFIQYGASTKRGTNAQTGGFGLGAKSPFAYTDSFTITTFIDGTKRTYIAHIGANKEGRLDLVSTDKTDELNGTEISIAAKPHDISEFKNAIIRASYFWKKEEMPEFIGADTTTLTLKPDGMLVGPHLELIHTNLHDSIGVDDYSNRVAFIIDGIPYIPGSKLMDLPNMKALLQIASKGSVLIHIGNGVVEVSASRESIADSELTKNNLNKLCGTIKNTLSLHLKTLFAAVKTNADWIKTYHDLSLVANVDSHSKYGDYEIYRSAIVSNNFTKIVMVNISKKWGRRRTGTETSVGRDPMSAINLDKIDEVFYLDSDESMVMQNRRAREYMDKHNRTSIVLLSARKPVTIDPTKAYLKIDGVEYAADDVDLPAIPTHFTEKEYKDALAKVISDFNAKPLSSLPFTPVVRVPKAKRIRTREAFTIHDCRYGKKSPKTVTLEQVAADMGHTKNKYLFVNIKDWAKYEHEFYGMAKFLYGQGMILCALTTDSISLVSAEPAFSSYEAWKKGFTPTKDLINMVKSIKAKNYRTMKYLGRADVKIKDKHLAKMVEEYKTILEKTGEVPDLIMKLVTKEILRFLQDDEKLSKLIDDNYSLVRTFTDLSDWKIEKKQANELVTYVNAKA